jgi:flagellar export protein FliJ
MSAAFKFRLQRVLDYRGTQEEEAKQILAARRAATREVEFELEEIAGRRQRLWSDPVQGVIDHLEREGRLAKSDFDKRLAETALAVLRDEENAAEEFWRERRKDLEIMKKLQEKKLAEWTLDENRKEQAAFDEWAVLRRLQAA